MGNLIVGDDVVVGGELRLGASGVSRVWREQLRPGAGLWPWTVQPCAAAAVKTVSWWEGYTLDFDGAASETAVGLVVLPPWYGGEKLLFDLMWAAGSGSGDVRWRVKAECLEHGEALAFLEDTYATVVATMSGANALQRTRAALTPKNAAGNALMQVLVQRTGSNAADTLDGVDAWLFGVGVSVAQS